MLDILYKKAGNAKCHLKAFIISRFLILNKVLRIKSRQHSVGQLTVTDEIIATTDEIIATPLGIMSATAEIRKDTIENQLEFKGWDVNFNMFNA